MNPDDIRPARYFTWPRADVSPELERARLSEHEALLFLPASFDSKVSVMSFPPAVLHSWTQAHPAGRAGDPLDGRGK